MTILERSNLHGDRVTREMPRAECTTPEPNALYSAAIDRMCAAATAERGARFRWERSHRYASVSACVPAADA